LLLEIGEENVTFTLTLQQNPEYGCSSSSYEFYDQFDGIDFDYLVYNTADLI
jgi:hypothetical protein